MPLPDMKCQIMFHKYIHFLPVADVAMALKKYQHINEDVVEL